MNIYDQLMSQGYYIGSGYDIFSENELIKLENNVSKILPNTPIGHTKWMRFITAQFPHNKKLEETNTFIPLNELENRLKFIKDNDGKVDQQWYFSDISALPIHNFDALSYSRKISNFIGEIYDTDSRYIHLNPLNVTYYAKDDFIDEHRDGKNLNRLCAFLLYFGNNQLHIKEQGGRLIINSTGEPIYIEPVRPNYVILDFTKHNILHAVEKCATDFNRFTLLCFPTLGNIPSNL